jgi:hypothetical protein
MNIPFDITLSLRSGTVYNFEHREFHSVEPHFFVVLNSDALSQQVLLMSVFTSKVEKQIRGIKRAGHADETLVEISPSDYSELSVESCVNCNKVFSKPLAELISQWPNVRKKPTDLPPEILGKIIVGVELSKVVAEEEKALIRISGS